MPWYVCAYILVFSTALFLNGATWVGSTRPRLPFLLFAYELLSGAYMLMMLWGFWSESLFTLLSPLNSAVFLIVFGLDFYYTVFEKMEDFGFKQDAELTAFEFDLTKAFSVLFASPCYVFGTVCAQKLIFH